MTRRQKVTLAEVARAAGVSTPTASRVLNGRGEVSVETRRRVEEALRQFEYLPPATRRTGSRVHSIELVFSDFRNPYFAEILQGVNHAAEEAGIAVVLGRHTERRSRMGPAPDQQRTGGRDRRGRRSCRPGTSRPSRRRGSDWSSSTRSTSPRWRSAASARRTGRAGLSATDHLVQLGHRRIAFVGGPQTMSCALARLHGYRAALDGAGIDLDPDLVSHGEFTHASGLARAGSLLELANPPTAVVAGCDPIAFGVIEAARLRGISVPDDLSVVGFDDSYAAAWFSPPLTTVYQPLQEMGRAAVRILRESVSGSSPDSHHIELATHLVVRESTAPLS